MMDVVPKLSYAVSRYASYRLCANVQFSAIEIIMQSIKIDPSIIYMLPDHKLKKLQMRYQEGQNDYYGKKGMSLLGIIEIRLKVDGEFSGFEYSSFSCLIKGYSVQDHV